MSRNFILALLLTTPILADGPADNIAEKVRPVPPPGIAIPEKDREELSKGVAKLGKEIEGLRRDLAAKPNLLALLPDVEIFHNAVRYALAHDEFYDVKEIPVAREFVKLGNERAEALRAGKSPWTSAKGLVVRGYRSKIDGSVQPYGLVVPESFNPKGNHRHRLDLWCHGRGEKLTELNFLNGRMKAPGEFVPPKAFVLHLYGRYCNANKFAGEIDALEAMDSVKAHYPIDVNRVVVRGFSMGGAACWQFAVHYPDLWAAAAPGAGFSETPEFLKFFQKETLDPTWYEKKLWHWYDATDYALNISNVPTVAYSGENDIQKQAADIMAEALKKEGMSLLHIIGPKTGHSYHPEAKKEINRRIDALAESGRKPIPSSVNFTTYTLRYNRCFWVTIDALEKHWEKAIVKAELSNKGGPVININVVNVNQLTIDFPSGPLPFAAETGPVTINIGEDKLVCPLKVSDQAWKATIRKSAKGWQLATEPETDGLRKRHALQGPIDDAFLDSFLFVTPTGQARHEKVGQWVKAEQDRAISHWRKQFRGEVRIKEDHAVTEADIREHNLILWGDPGSNTMLGKIADKLPIGWTSDKVTVGSQAFDAATHAPVLIYPNPLNPKKYVVLNSGFTFRDYDYLNNARQVPKLPDWAVIDLRTPPNSRWPGKVAAAGFFDERWQLGK